MREEEKEIERALAGGKVYQIREVKKLLDKALSSQLKEVRDKTFEITFREMQKINAEGWDWDRGDSEKESIKAVVLAEVKKLV